MYTSIPRKCIDTISTKFVSPECYLTIRYFHFLQFVSYIHHTHLLFHVQTFDVTNCRRRKKIKKRDLRFTFLLYIKYFKYIFKYTCGQKCSLELPYLNLYTSILYLI